MSENTRKYGFRWFYGQGAECPRPIEKVVASGYQAQNDGGTMNVGLSVGDPVRLVSDGTVALANTTQEMYGVILGFEPYWTGSEMRFTDYLPGGTAWGTNQQRASRVLVAPFLPGQLWELDCDDNVTATTEAAYRALEGENVTMICPGDNSISGRPVANPLIDISTRSTSASLILRLEKLSPTVENQRFDWNWVKFLVSVNRSQAATQAATTIAGV